MAPVGMTAISSRGPPAPRRMTEPLPNCRSICEIASSRACRRSFLASAMRLSLFILARILARSLHVSFVIAFGHSRWPCSGASMSRDSDRGPKRHLRQLGVTGSAGPKLAPHQGGAWNQHPAEFTHRREAESLREREFGRMRSEEHTSELQSRGHLVCRLLLEKKKRPHRRKATRLHRDWTGGARTTPRSRSS